MSARRLGDYELSRRLAVGGMAEVYLARPRSGKLCGDPPIDVVLKLLLPQHAKDPSFVAMFGDEAQLAARLDHPALVRVLDSGRVGDEHFLVMEYVDGVTLAALLDHTRRTAEPLSPALALGIAAQLLEGLRYLHTASDESGRPLDVVHRDVTPGNVLLSRKGAVKLADFGIARHRLRQARTRTGVIKGTVQYMAPEQIAEDRVDRRADLYGVGLLLFELLTGHPFLEAEREVELLSLAAEPVWRAPSSLRADLDPRLDQLLRPALQRFAEQRYRDADAFLAALERTRDELALEGDATQLAQTLGTHVALTATVNLGDETPSIRPPQTQTEEPEAAPVRVTQRKSPGPPLTVSTLATNRSWLAVLLVSVLLVAAGATYLASRQSKGVTRAPVVDAARTQSPNKLDSGAPTPADRGATTPRDAAVATPHDSRLPRADLPRADLRRRTHRRTHHRSRPDARLRKNTHRKPDAGRPAPLPPDPAGPALYQALRTLRARGIRRDDLSSSLRKEVVGLEGALARKERGHLPRVQALASKLAALRVDAKLVKAKLARVHARLRRLPAAKRKPLDERASLALQDFMDGRHAAANRQLEAILSALK